MAINFLVSNKHGSPNKVNPRKYKSSLEFGSNFLAL